MIWNFLTSENAGATHSNAFTVSTASVHLPIFLVEDRWLICCWKCSQIQADLPLGLSLHATESSHATCDWLPQANGTTVTYVQYIGHFYYEVAIVGVLYPSSHQLGAYRKYSGWTRPLTHLLPQEPLYA